MTPSLSLVVVCFEMERELPRTLLSLTSPYQRGIAEDEWEIIVVDNGSRHPPRAEDFAKLRGNLRILRCSRPGASPVRAINQGLSAARGALIGVWIDGARLASPGLLAACRAAARMHPRPVIATLNYQLGPQRQFLSAERGYDQQEEDRLLDSIDWPLHGERVFEIATCELGRADTDPMLESNALFMPGALWHELGGYDESFDEPGGGMVNPDTYIRACALPGTQVIRVLGEGTFHQFHGGLSTSTRARAIETLQSGSRAYLRRRGRPLAPVRDPGLIFDARIGALVAS